MQSALYIAIYRQLQHKFLKAFFPEIPAVGSGSVPLLASVDPTDETVGMQVFFSWQNCLCRWSPPGKFSADENGKEWLRT